MRVSCDAAESSSTTRTVVIDSHSCMPASSVSATRNKHAPTAAGSRPNTSRTTLNLRDARHMGGARHLLQDIRNIDPTVTFALSEDEALANAANADVIVVVVGELAYAEGVGDTPRRHYHSLR